MQLGFGHLPETCKGPAASEPEKPPIPDDLKLWYSVACDKVHFKTDYDAIKKLIERIAKAESQVAELTATLEGHFWDLKKVKKDAWFNDFRPVINAIGEISVQEAMDGIERYL